MRRFIVAAVAVLVAVPALRAQDFDKAWPATEFASKFGADLYGGAVRPVWTDADTFVFETNEPSGKVWYKVAGTAKTPITEDEFKEATKRPRPGYYDPSDESQFGAK
jgi:hypothetical protein